MNTISPRSARFIGPEVLQKGATNPITCPVYHGGALVAPTGGTVTLYSGAGATLHSASVTVSGSIATASLAGSVTSSLTPADDLRLEWALSFSGDAAATIFTRSAVLALRRLHPVITDADLLRRHSDLTERRPSTESSYQDYIDEAWAQIEGRLIAAGNRPWLILNQEALRPAHLALALALVFEDFASGGPGSTEWERAARYRAEWDSEWNALRLTYADPTSGTDPDPGTKKGARPPVFLMGRY